MAQRTTSRPPTARKKAPSATPRDVAGDVAYALEWLERRGTKKNRDGMARYGIVADKVFGVSMSTMQSLAKELGRDHKLSEALWKTGWYEARMLASLVGEPDRVTPAQMERWAKSFDNWAVCDTATFVLWDRTPHAWGKVREWSGRKEEFVKRAGQEPDPDRAGGGGVAPPEIPPAVRADYDEVNSIADGCQFCLEGV